MEIEREHEHDNDSASNGYDHTVLAPELRLLPLENNIFIAGCIFLPKIAA